MKKSANFIDSISPKESKKLMLWWHCSWALLMVMIVIIAVVQARQLFAWQAIKRDFNEIRQQDLKFQELQKKVSELQNEEKQLRIRMDLLSKAKGNSQKILARCKAILQTNPEIVVQSFESSDQSTQMTVVAPSVEKVYQWMQALNQSGSYSYLTLTSLQQRDKAFLFTIKEGR